MNGGLPRFNELPDHEAETELWRCLASPRWAQAVAAGRPYASRAALLAAGAAAWEAVGETEWREAIRHHPRLGRPEEGGEKTAATREWSRAEQGGLADSGTAIRAALAGGQEAYERRFGFRFLYCAANRSGEDMLSALEARLANTPEKEVQVAADELWKIARLRLQRLCE